MRRLLGGLVQRVARPRLQPGVVLTARFLVDCGVVIAANSAAFALRFELAMPASMAGLMLDGLLIAAACYAAAFLALGTHRSMWRYVGLEELRRLILGAGLGAGLHSATVFGLGWHAYPGSVLLVTPIFVIVWCGGLRLARRLSAGGPGRKRRAPAGEQRRIVIIGAGSTGESIAREVRRRRALGYEVVGFVDDDPRLQGQTIHDLPVLGRIDELSEVAARHAIGEAVIAIPRLRVSDLRRIGTSCGQAGLLFRCLPSVTQLVRGDGKLRYLRKLDIDELLTREKKSVDEASVRALLHDTCVMVTGAGGSIGSELCRQALRLGARPVLLVERAENALYDIAQEIRRHYGEGAAIPVLADVRHVGQMAEVFERYRPRIVFHTAAYKHVPMLEDHPIEAVLNNVVGTRRLADLARRSGVARFVFVSTDKAANPKNVMGATKKICEMYVRALDGAGSPTNGTGAHPANGAAHATNGRAHAANGAAHATNGAAHATNGNGFHASNGTGMRSVVVRFGNVLGSAGSVIPLFEQQVEDGASITITHPEVSRFFMTVSEAVGLVLQSAAMARGGEIFVLDMGEPKKIADLADDVVVALGLAPGDVSRRYIGLRPGEKLHETLWEEGENGGRSEHEKVFMVKGNPPAVLEVETLVKTLETLALAGNVTEMLRKIGEVVPSYGPTRDRRDLTPGAVPA